MENERVEDQWQAPRTLNFALAKYDIRPVTETFDLPAPVQSTD